jgi:hypothetical protein
MRGAAVLAAVVALVAPATAGLNRTYLVPVYDACPGSGNCFPPVRSSTYTFDSIVLFSSPKPYTGPGKLALQVAIKGLRDAGGNAVTGKLQLRVKTRITLPDIGTIGENSPLAETVYVIDVTNGNGKGRFTTPDITPAGLVANSFGSPVLHDPEGKELATAGTQSKP